MQIVADLQALVEDVAKKPADIVKYEPSLALAEAIRWGLPRQLNRVWGLKSVRSAVGRRTIATPCCDCLSQASVQCEGRKHPMNLFGRCRAFWFEFRKRELGGGRGPL